MKQQTLFKQHTTQSYKLNWRRVFFWWRFVLLYWGYCYSKRKRLGYWRESRSMLSSNIYKLSVCISAYTLAVTSLFLAGGSLQQMKVICRAFLINCFPHCISVTTGTNWLSLRVSGRRYSGDRRREAQASSRRLWSTARSHNRGQGLGTWTAVWRRRASTPTTTAASTANTGTVHSQHMQGYERNFHCGFCNLGFM